MLHLSSTFVHSLGMSKPKYKSTTKIVVWYREVVSIIEQADEVIVVFLQHACVRYINRLFLLIINLHKRFGTKVAGRRMCITFVASLYLALSPTQRTRFTTFLIKLSRNKNLHSRMVSIESCTAVLQLLMHCANVPQQLYNSLLDCIVARLRDKSSQVRARAVKCITELVYMYVKAKQDGKK